MAVCKAVSSKGGIGGILNYVLDKEKTKEELVSGIECCSFTAKEEMEATKELWGKTGGRTYKHFIISYAPDEQITPLKAHKNALSITENTEAFKGFECLLSTHTDTEHIHTHVIVNSVSFEDGHKLQWSKQDLVDFKRRVNVQCIEQGLTVTEKGKHFDGSINDDVSTWDKNKQKVLEKAFTGDYKSYLLDVANAVAKARQQATSRESFIELMSEQNIKTEWKDTHKNITFTTSEGKKVRNSNLEKTFKVDFGKDGLENEFQTNNLIESEKLIEWQFDGSNFGKIKK
ncbi:MAG: relaxase/mobilization nuclease domain-containing protein [Clostridia bacterium]